MTPKICFGMGSFGRQLDAESPSNLGNATRRSTLGPRRLSQNLLLLAQRDGCWVWSAAFGVLKGGSEEGSLDRNPRVRRRAYRGSELANAGVPMVHRTMG